MENFNININLLKLKAVVADVPGKNGKAVRSVIIPIEANDLFASLDEQSKIKGVYLSLSAWQTKQESQYGDTHMVKQSHSKGWVESHSEDERRNQPILGNAKPIVSKTIADVKVETTAIANVETASTEGEPDDLPF